MREITYSDADIFKHAADFCLSFYFCRGRYAQATGIDSRLFVARWGFHYGSIQARIYVKNHEHIETVWQPFGSNDYPLSLEIEDYARKFSHIVKTLLPTTEWEHILSYCSGPSHDEPEFALLKLFAGKWLCHECEKALSLSSPIFSASNKPKQYQNERQKMTASMRWQILERDQFTCRSCGRTAREVRLHVDHKIPISMGGKTEPDNLHTLCVECNLGKSDKMPTQTSLEFWQ